MKTRKIFEELGAWLMAVTFIFFIFNLAAFMVENVHVGDNIQNGSYTARIDLRLLQDNFKSDSVEMKPVLLK